MPAAGETVDAPFSALIKQLLVSMPQIAGGAKSQAEQ
jgi:hypothetical protein